MNILEIFFSEDSELSEFDAINKGCRLDVFVKMHRAIYHVRIYTLIRLQQDFDDAMEEEGYYYPDPNMILVKETSKEEIISAIKWLSEQGYFSQLKILSDADIDRLMRFQNIDIEKLVKIQ